MIHLEVSLKPETVVGAHVRHRQNDLATWQLVPIDMVLTLTDGYLADSSLPCVLQGVLQAALPFCTTWHVKFQISSTDFINSH